MRTFIGGLFLSIFLGQQFVSGQSDSLTKPVKTYVEAGALLTSGTAVPFWLRANQYGVVPLVGSLTTYRAGHFVDYKAGNAARFDWGYGLELVGNVGRAGQQLILPQAYLKARWHQLELYAGRRKYMVGLVDTLLTSGSYAMSGNALPLPTVQLGTRGFVPMPFTKGIVSIYATYGHAWFETVNRKVEHTLLHQATFMLAWANRPGRCDLLPVLIIRLFGGAIRLTWATTYPITDICHPVSKRICTR